MKLEIMTKWSTYVNVPSNWTFWSFFSFNFIFLLFFLEINNYILGKRNSKILVMTYWSVGWFLLLKSRYNYKFIGSLYYSIFLKEFNQSFYYIKKIARKNPDNFFIITSLSIILKNIEDPQIYRTFILKLSKL